RSCFCLFSSLLLLLIIPSRSSLPFFFFFYCSRPHLYLHSFPTRRSSDLIGLHTRFVDSDDLVVIVEHSDTAAFGVIGILQCHGEDRKSTRLNSSHVSISYAVFCLKKKNIGDDRVYVSDDTQRDVDVSIHI